MRHFGNNRAPGLRQTLNVLHGAAVRAALLILPFSALPVCALTTDTNVTARGFGGWWTQHCDRVTWTDRQGLTRAAYMVRSDGDCDASVGGGHLCRLEWNDGTNSKISTQYQYCDDLEGFGSTVNHSTAGYATQGRWGGNRKTRFVLRGDHYALWQLNSDVHIYPDSTSPVFPMTVAYAFRDGEDQFEYIITHDCSALASIYNDDSKSPYCKFDWDCDGAETTTISGLGWGTSHSVLVNLITQAWTCNPTNIIPYVWEFNHETGFDNEYGCVATRPYANHYAGSGKVPALAPSGTGLSTMTEYQLNMVQGWQGNRCTWGVPYGSLTQTAQVGITQGQENYSLAVIIDRYSSNGVLRLVSEAEAVHNAGTTLTATVGSVASTGLESVGLPRVITYDKAGFDQLFRDWALIAATNQVTATLTVVAGKTLPNPTFCVRNYSALSKPSTVQKNGTSFAEGTGYYCTLDTLRQECWVTFISDFSGASTVNIAGAAGTFAFTGFSASQPSISNQTSTVETFTATVSGAGSVAVDLSALGGGTSVAMNHETGDMWTIDYTVAAGIVPTFKTITATATSSGGVKAARVVGIQVRAGATVIATRGTLVEEGSSRGFRVSKVSVVHRTVAIETTMPCSIRICDVSGAVCGVLTEGNHIVSWTAPVSGVFFVMASSGSLHESRRILVR